ncbi:hypothetical protein KSS87_007324 [Heliosperma pusillum]|nr:hypothetical protein KSS87_007324 [Heliosperma pusillum]
MGDKKLYISEEELKIHNKKNDIWISILGKIYNVSNWVNQHPGGELPLLYFAGQDVTDVFLAYHPKSSWLYLDKFFTGYYLKDYKVSEISKDYRNLVSNFQKIGFFDNKGHGIMILMLITLIMFCVSVYGILISNVLWVHLICGGLMGFSWIQIGWIGHDSAHYQAMINPKFNSLAHFVLVNCLSGVSIAWWKRSHNAHHIACNALEFDPDMQHLPIFAVSSKFFDSLTSYFYERKMNFGSISRVLVRHQNLTFYPIFAFLRIFMYAQSFYVLLSRTKVTNRFKELIGLVIFWIWFPLLVSSLPTWFERITFTIVTLAVTGIQQFQFCLNHLSCEAYLGPPSGSNWFEKQITGSLDIECSPWMDWFHGGLQFQIEHHLFPRMPRHQLRKISPFVKELCKKHSLPYSSMSFWKANVVTFNTVHAAAIEAREFSNCIPKNMLWEAMTTHG